jgi:sulfur carrier protein ThiS adenylyltransferase
VVFACVDSIVARELIWNSVRGQAAFYADARMSAEVVRVLASDRPTSDAYYPTTLFAAAQAYAGSCTAKSTVYTASIAAGLMVSAFTRWLRGLPVERDLVLNLLAAELTTA